jgi:hypothetical protein
MDTTEDLTVLVIELDEDEVSRLAVRETLAPMKHRSSEASSIAGGAGV